MKNENKLNLINEIDDNLILGADPESIRKKKKSKLRFRWGALVACFLCAVLAINLAIFLPMFWSGDDYLNKPDSGSSVQSSYDKIKEIINLSFPNNPNYNYGTSDGVLEDSMASGTPSPGNPDAGSSYVEVTDNQVQDVIEADLFKRTTTHIFYLRDNAINAYSIKGADSALVGTLQFSSEALYDKTMYLSNDGRIATVIYTKCKDSVAETMVATINVENPEEMKLVKSNAFTGSYVDSRYANGELLLFTRFSFTKTDEEEDFIPAIDTGDGYTLLKPDSIIAPEVINTKSYLTISKLNGEKLSLCGSVALLGYGDTMYISSSSIYPTRTINEFIKNDNLCTYTNKTEIARIDYSDSLLSVKGVITVNGTVKDQYCMDELNGVLRVFTSTSEGYYYIYNSDNDSVSSSVTSGSPASPGVSSSSGSAETTPSIGQLEPTTPQRSNTSANTTSASLYCIDNKNDFKRLP